MNEAIQRGVEIGDWIVRLVEWKALVVDRGVLSAEAGRLALISCGQVAVLVVKTVRFGEGYGAWREEFIGWVEQDDGSGVLDGVYVAGVVGLLAGCRGLFVRNDGSVTRYGVLDAGYGVSGARYGVLGVGFAVPGVMYGGSGEQFDVLGQPVGGWEVKCR